MKTTTRTLVVCLIAWLTVAGLADAQEADEERPVFEIADVHPSAGAATIHMPSGINSRMRGFTGNGRYELRTATMVDLIANAYGVEADRVAGGPNWLDTDHFDVIAKVPAGATRESLRRMLQALLADRFGLVVHNDTRLVAGFALIAGKRPLLKEAAGGGEGGCQSPPQSPQSNASDRITLSCHNASIAEFVSQLPRFGIAGAGDYLQGNPVVDLTGLKGSWDFSLRWTARNRLTVAGTDGVTIYDAIEKQLGLQLEAQMVPTPVIVVDSVNEKPTDNPPGVSENLTAIPTRFEVADIKPSVPGSAQRSFRAEPGGRVDARGFTLKDLIKFAWEIEDLDVIDNDDLLAGAPKWLGDERFDIVAEASADGLPAGARLDTNSARLMLRGLLEDRFKLRTHSEPRPVTVYRMVAARPKLKRADPSNRPGCRPGAALSASSPVFSLHCQNTSMTQLADELPAYGALYVNHPVVDETGLAGGWDFDLGWSPPHLVRSGEMAAANDPNGALTIVEAMDKQLGLKLELGKHEMPVLVIDHVAREPTEN